MVFMPQTLDTFLCRESLTLKSMLNVLELVTFSLSFLLFFMHAILVNLKYIVKGRVYLCCFAWCEDSGV